MAALIIAGVAGADYIGYVRFQVRKEWWEEVCMANGAQVRLVFAGGACAHYTMMRLLVKTSC